MNLLKASNLSTIGVLALLTACQTPTTYHAYQSTPFTDWGKHDTLLYTPTLTAGTYQIEVAIRHHELYPYKNLALEICYGANDSTCLRKDSVAFTLTNEDGKWYGTGISSLYQLTYPEKKMLNITQGDTLKEIRISHMMRNVTLEGITDVGIRIDKME